MKINLVLLIRSTSYLQLVPNQNFFLVFFIDQFLVLELRLKWTTLLTSILSRIIYFV